MLDLSDRTHCFYWQTDRDLSVQDYEKFFLQRQTLTSDEITALLKKNLNPVLGNIHSIKVIDANEEVQKGNVNVVRKVGINGKTYIARIHPRGIRNGYFFVEKLALDRAAKQNVPAPQTIHIHEAVDESDMDFSLMTEMPGITMESTIKNNPETENDLLREAGRIMAQIHHIEVEGYGSFNNQIAKTHHTLVGLHDTYKDFIFTGLEENIQRLLKFEAIDTKLAHAFRLVFETQSYSPIGKPRMVHNDFADWNILSDDNHITAILDWDECHAGDPVADLACWSTFFSMERMKPLMQGYTSIARLPDDYEQRFHYYRLRYTISKMALRVKRMQVDTSQRLKDLIVAGKQALHEEVTWLRSS